MLLIDVKIKNVFVDNIYFISSK